MLNGKKFIRVGIFSLFASLFCIGNYSSAKLYNVDTTYQYNYNILNWDFEITSDLNFPYEKPIQFAGNQCNATTIFWYDKKLWFITQRWFNTANCNQEAWQVVQWFFTKICKVSYLNNNDQALILWRNFNCPSNWRVDIEEFYNTTWTLTSIAFMEEYYANYPRNFCFNFQDINTSYCVLTNLRTSDARPNQYSWFDFTTVTNYEDLLNYESPSPNSPRTPDTPTWPEINYACPTIQQLINTYPSQYNTWLCYSSSLIFSWWTIQQVTPKDIFTLYPLYTWFVADINLYNNYCVWPNTQTACETAFEGKTEQYTLISKIPDNVKKANLYAYCNLELNYEDKNASTCVTSGAINTGEYIPPITNQWVIDELIDGDYNIVLPASWYVMDTLKDENWERKIDRNIIESIQNLYSKFTTIFTGREWNNGIIPEYITRMLLVIILFAFFKK